MYRFTISVLSFAVFTKHQTHTYTRVQGRTAYVAQQSWIQNLTVRNNILFGSKANEITYDHVVQACELQSDLDMLPAGDATEIGERVRMFCCWLLNLLVIVVCCSYFYFVCKEFLHIFTICLANDFWLF